MPAHRAPHQGTLRLRGRTGRAVGQQPRRAQPAPSGYQPQDQRGHPVGTWYREQDDAGIHLRHLARTRPEPPRRLPPTAHFPSNLNSYFWSRVATLICACEERPLIPSSSRDVAISMRLNTRRRTVVATPMRLPRYARNDKVGSHEVMCCSRFHQNRVRKRRWHSHSA